MKQTIFRLSLLAAAAVCALALFFSANRLRLAQPGGITVKEASVSNATFSEQVHKITVKTLNGYVAVYEDGILSSLTDIPVVSLPSADRDALSAGIDLTDEQALHQLLEDLGA